MFTSRHRYAIPLSLTLLRVLLAPVVILLALRDARPWAFGVCLSMAFLSDVFDGIIARRLRVATSGLRRLDSLADTVFYGAAVFALWHLQRDVLVRYGRALWALAALELTRYGIDFAKFRREASYHMWSSKFWGLVLFAAFFSVLVLGRFAWLLPAAITVGIAADLEGIAISLILPHWKNDVPTFLHALRIRRAIQ